jgi:hypothetical protein
MVDNDAEYRAHKAFLLLMVKRYFDVGTVAAASLPGNKLEALEGKSMRAAKSGLRSAIADLIAMSQQVRGAELDHLDAWLKGQGAPTLTRMRITHSSKLNRILARGTIKGRAEYDLVNEWLVVTSGAPEGLHARAQHMVDAWTE